MKALLRRAGGARLEEVPPPSAAAGEVLVRVAVAGVCRTDVYAARGEIPCRDGVVLGHEFSGTLDGAPVAVMPAIGCGGCETCRRGLAPSCPARSFLGLDRDGAFAELVAVPERAVFALPPGLSLEDAAWAEPVSAALAVLKAGLPPSGRGLIYGDNRIARLVERVLKASGFSRVEVQEPAAARSLESAYDYAIESVPGPDTLRVLAQVLVPGGKAVLKSRWRGELPFPLARAVEKELSFFCAHYAPFPDALALLASGRLRLGDLAGGFHRLEDFPSLFSGAGAGERTKPFFRLAGPYVRDSSPALSRAAG